LEQSAAGRDRTQAARNAGSAPAGSLEWKQAELKPRREGGKKKSTRRGRVPPDPTRPCCSGLTGAMRALRPRQPAQRVRRARPKPRGARAEPPPKNRRLSASTFPCSPRLGIVGAEKTAATAHCLFLFATPPRHPLARSIALRAYRTPRSLESLDGVRRRRWGGPAPAPAPAARRPRPRPQPPGQGGRRSDRHRLGPPRDRAGALAGSRRRETGGLRVGRRPPASRARRCSLNRRRRRPCGFPRRGRRG